MIRDKFGKTLITSGFRTDEHNKKVGGAKNSRHLISDAVDFSIPGVPLLDIARYAESIGIKGIIIYNRQGFIHIDNRPTKYFFYENEKKQVQTFI